MTPQLLPEPLVEAARDLLRICEALDVPTPAAQLLQSSDQTKVTQVTWAYSAAAEAFELAANVQRNHDHYGLDAVVAVLAAIMLRRVARELEVETDRWDNA